MDLLNNKFLTTCSFLVITVYCAYSQKLDYDIKQGAEASKQLAEKISIDTTSGTAQYIISVGNRLVSNLDDPQFNYRFHLVDMFEPNAFALPGGYIYVTRGILMLLNSEDELAGIIGHEIIHSYNRHSYKAAKKNVLPTILKAPGNVVGLVNEGFGNLINAPLEFTSSLHLAKYGRKQETEADTYGVQLSAESGYQPLALADALENLAADIRYLTGEEEKYSYFNDHPFTPDRINNINELSKTLTVSEQVPVAKSKSEFLKRIEGIYIGTHPAQGVIKGNRFFHAGLDLDITFPEDWIIQNNSTHVAAQQPGEEAMVFLLVAGTDEPSIIAEKFIEKFRNKYRVESYRAEPLDFNGYPAYVFGVDERSGRNINNSSTIWIKKGGITYQVVGSGLKKYEKDFENVAKSIKPLTSETSAEITGIKLKIASARDGETIRSFSQRTGNALNEEFTALINSLPQNIKLKEGQLIKIGQRVPYVLK